jgi:membrane-associated phospholipid phosphatase
MWVEKNEVDPASLFAAGLLTHSLASSMFLGAWLALIGTQCARRASNALHDTIMLSIRRGRCLRAYGLVLACSWLIVANRAGVAAQSNAAEPDPVATTSAAPAPNAATTAQLATASSESANAPNESGVAWKRHWPKVHLVEYVVTGALVVGALALTFGVDPQTHGGQGGVLYDNGVRSLLRAETRSGRDAARIVGDMGYRVLLLYPFLDLLITPLAVHGNPEVAWQMLAMDAEVMAIAGFVGIFTDHVFGRARPSQRECAQDSHYERFCNGEDQFGSFLSGHSAIAAAGAGLTCAHHLNMPLYGGGAADVIACAAAATIAVTTGVARIVNDRHWATDVTAGLLIGGLAGYGIPALFHYRSAPESQLARDRLRMQFVPTISTDRVTGTLLGSY